MGHTAPEPPDLERPVDEFVSMSQLLDKPGFARIYTYVLRHGPVTLEDILEDLDASPMRTEVDLEQLEQLGIVAREDSTDPETFTAEPVSLRLEADGVPYLLTPTFVGGVARMDEDDELRSFVRDRGIGGLATALTSAVRDLRGEDTDGDEVAEDHESVMGSMRDLADEYRDVDPYFEEL